MEVDTSLPAALPEFRSLSEQEVWEALVDTLSDNSIATEVTRLTAIYAAMLNTRMGGHKNAPHLLPLRLEWPIERVALAMLANVVDAEVSPRRDLLARKRKRPRSPLRLSPDDEAQLHRWRTHRAPLLRQRAAIILAWSQTTDSDNIAKTCDVSLSSVYKWRTVFLKRGLPGLLVGI